MVYLLPLLIYLAGPKSVSVRPADPDTMTVTAQEALSSGIHKGKLKQIIITIDGLHKNAHTFFSHERHYYSYAQELIVAEYSN